MARFGKHLQPAAWDQLVGCTPMRDGNDRVAFPPDHHERDRLGEVHAIGRVDPLAANVDDRPQRVQERGARVAVRQRGVTAQDLAEVRVHAQPDAAEQITNGPAKPKHPVVDQQRQDQLRARKAGSPQQRADLATKAAATHKHQPLAVFKKQVGELHRHATTSECPTNVARSRPRAISRSRIPAA